MSRVVSVRAQMEAKKFSGFFVVRATVFWNQYIQVILPFGPTTWACLQSGNCD